MLFIKFLAFALIALSVMGYNMLAPRSAITIRLKDVKKEDIGELGYGPMGSLLRQGPVPYFIRIVKPDTYDAAVKKYMALENVNRITAQANMGI